MYPPDHAMGLFRTFYEDIEVMEPLVHIHHQFNQMFAGVGIVYSGQQNGAVTDDNAIALCGSGHAM